MDRAPEHPGDLQARLGSRVLETPAAATDHDRLVLPALHPHQGVDHRASPLLGEALGLDGETVRKLLAQPPDELLPDDLGREERLAAIGEPPFRVHRNGDRHPRLDGGPEPFQVLAGAGAYRNHRREVVPPGHVVEHGKHRLAELHAVDLVEHEHHRRRLCGDLAENEIVVPDPARRLDDHEHEVDPGQRPRRGPVHVPVEGARARRVDPGGVDEDDLRRIARRDPQDPVAGGLRPAGGDAELAADDPVDERRLPHVRPPDDRGEPAAVAAVSLRAHRERPWRGPPRPAPRAFGSTRSRPPPRRRLRPGSPR